MSRILLGITGSVAAIKTPQLVTALRREGHDVKVVATTASLYFFDSAEFVTAANDSLPQFVCDADEFPGAATGRRWERGDRVLHIELRDWAEALVIAPLDAHTLAKLATGLCDNVLTCVWRAWHLDRPVLLAPAMNTRMWEHPLTQRQWRSLAELFAADADAFSAKTTLPELFDRLAKTSPLRVIGPITKTLACGDHGLGGMAEIETIVHAVNAIGR